MRILLLILATGIASSAGAVDRRTEEIFVIAANAADLITTEIWLNHGPYFDSGQLRIPSEKNPFAQGSFAKRAALKAGTTTATLLIARLLDRRGHDKAASVLRWSATVVYLGAASWNVSLSIRF